MRRYLLSVAVAIVACLGIGYVAYAAMAVPPPPANGYYVLDQTSTLSDEQVQKLNEQIGSYRKRTSVQLAVLMVPTIKDDYLENFSINVARTWGVGQKGKNNGVLLLIAKDDHAMRIEVGTGLEGDLTDARSSRIIRDRIAPEFRKGDFYEGIRSGLEGITLAISSSDDAVLAPENTVTTSSLGDMVELVFFLLFAGFGALTWLVSVLARTKSWWAGGILGGLGGAGGALFFNGGIVVIIVIAIVFALLGLFFDYAVSKNYRAAKAGGHKPSWWAGGTTLGGGGGFSGGGGFGGGGFGGGGASGSW